MKFEWVSFWSDADEDVCVMKFDASSLPCEIMATDAKIRLGAKDSSPFEWVSFWSEADEDVCWMLLADGSAWSWKEIMAECKEQDEQPVIDREGDQIL